MQLVLKGGNIFNSVNNDYREKTSLGIQNGVISKIEDFISAENVLDVSGCYIIPGLINAHVHLIWDAGPDPELSIINKPDTFVTLVAAKEAQKHLALGITTVRDVGSIGTSVIALRDAINRGIIEGPNILTSGPPIGMTGGHIHRIAIEANGADEVRAATRLNLKNNVDLIKLMATGGVYTEGEEPGFPQMTIDEMKAAVEETHKRAKKATAHAEGLEGIKNALLAGVDCIEHGIFADDVVIEMMVKNNTFLVPTIVCFERMAGEEAKERGVPDYALRKADECVKAQKVSFKKAVEAGVKIATGTDAGAPLNPPNDYYTELSLMKSAGMSNLDVLKASTSQAAELLSMPDIGMLEEGKVADIIVVEGDPLESLDNLQKIRYVIKSGRIVLKNEN
jgi:imidazolonepropionase-like amidohydrolase